MKTEPHFNESLDLIELISNFPTRQEFIDRGMPVGQARRLNRSFELDSIIDECRKHLLEKR